MSVVNMRGFMFLVAIFLLIVLFPVARRHAQVRSSIAGLQRVGSAASTDGNAVTRGSTAGKFIISRGDDGTECRQMTVAELKDLKLDDREQATINLSVSNAVKNAAQQQTGLKISLRGTSQLQSSPDARDAFLRAAARWEALVQSPISIIVDVDFGPTLFGTPYDSPNTIGSSDVQSLYSSTIYSSVRSALNAGASNGQQTAMFGALPIGSIPTDSGSTSGILTSSANFRALGLINATANPTTEAGNFGPPPSIGFNSAFQFDFDQSDGIDAGKIDFEAAAMHELGHVLGFVSWVGGRELDPTFPIATSVWDLFRVRTGTDLSSFTASRRFLLSGGDQFYFSGLQEQALSTGRPDGTGGDGEQSSHWKDDFFVGRLIGLLDPTLSSGRRERISSTDVEALSLFGYRINQTGTVYDEHSVDDGSVEASLSGTNAIFVNRITPQRYPAKVETVRVRYFIAQTAPSPSGSSLRVVVFADPTRTGTPPANPTLLFDRTIVVGALPSSRFLEIPLANGPSIDSGDFYIGIQSTTEDVRFGGDLDGRIGNRSFVSVNNGASFTPLRVGNGSEVDVNLMARAEISSPIGGVPTPTLEALSPSAAAPGDPGLTLFVNGHDFQTNSVVRWNNSDRVTAFISGTQLRATIPASDLTAPGTAKVTVVTPGGTILGDQTSPNSTDLTFTISPTRPVPAILRLDPGEAAVGTSGLTLTVSGTNFNAASVLRWNGAERATLVTNSVKLSAVITAEDLALPAGAKVTVFTPSPGGGESNTLVLPVAPCSFDLSVSSLAFKAAGGVSGINLTTSSSCAWTAQSSVPWLTTGITGGTGKSVITLQVISNTSPSVRTGVLTIGGQQIPVRQLGLLSSVSAASFSGPLSPESIAAAFGAGLASETTVGSTLPLPTEIKGTSITVTDSTSVTRTAGMFFTSPGQINFLVPPGTASGTANITAYVDGLAVANGTVTVFSVAPAIFTANSSGSGVPAAFVLRIHGEVQTTEDVSRFDASQGKHVATPIEIGPEGDRVFLILFGTGIRGATSVASVTAKIGDQTMPVAYAGQQGSYAGQDQVNIELQRTLIGKGEVSVILTINGRSSNTVTVSFK
jgi:uncharacterized protein (TIGR03437 family)